MEFFIIGLLTGALLGREGVRGCCGCLVLFVGILFALFAFLVFLAAFIGGSEWGERILSAFVGSVAGFAMIWLGWWLLTKK
mgnify:CR=1 FL=1